MTYSYNPKKRDVSVPLLELFGGKKTIRLPTTFPPWEQQESHKNSATACFVPYENFRVGDDGGLNKVCIHHLGVLKAQMFVKF
jgi:hypothetical protein